MERYHPQSTPNAQVWLALDEDEHILLVERAHRRVAHKLPNVKLHAVFHVIVENQLAMGVSSVRETLDRLRSEGLSRHDAIHAIGSVVVSDVHGMLSEQKPHDAERYRQALAELTAEKWFALADEE